MTPSVQSISRRASFNKPNRRFQSRMSPGQVNAFLSDLFGDDLHAKRVLSLSNGVVGVLHAAALGIHAIGLALAAAVGLQPKHAIKQVDRLLSNAGVSPWSLFQSWVPFVLAQRTEAVIALDWTDFEADDHTTCAAHLITTHGRATPLVWKTLKKSELEGQRNCIQNQLIDHLQQIIPLSVNITLLADQGFGDQKLYDRLDSIGWDYIIRFRENIIVTDERGESKPARQWVPSSGRPRLLRNALVTTDRMPVGAVVVVKAPRMKEAWCLATSRTELTASRIMKLYGRRFTVEESFRDEKDNKYGMGLSATHIKDCARRDRILLLGALAQALLTLLGAASEEVGLDRLIKGNTIKRRTHSLFRQGTYWFSCIPNMREEWLRPLMEAFGRLLSSHAVFCEVFGVI